MTTPSDIPALAGEDLTVRYGEREPILNALSLSIPAGRVTAIIGPNGSGKSTLLKTLARRLPAERGTVRLLNEDIADLAPRELAARLAIQFQEPVAPEDLSVADLVAFGRFPHQRFLESPRAEDHAAINEALERAGVAALRERRICELSSGQRRLVWIAMALAQQTGILLLDEPTTFLDLARAFRVMEVAASLPREHGQTVVIVLHDLALAARYADHLIALRDGVVVRAGAVADVLTPETVRRVFEVDCELIRDPRSGRPLVVPYPGEALSAVATSGP